MSVRDGLLALLTVGPNYGYQLKTELEQATGDAWSLNVGQVYTTLGRLERDGLVLDSGEDSEGRKRYALTDTGEAEATAWFANAVDRSAEARDEVALKVLLAVATGSADAQAVISTQRAASMSTLQSYGALRLGAEDSEVAWLLHLDRLSLATEAELKWLDLAEARLEGASPKTNTLAPDTTTKGEVISHD